MTKDELIPYVSHVLDDALSPDHVVADILTPEGKVKPLVRLVAWQCGFEPLVVAVFSYLDVQLDEQDAEDIARDYLLERNWFTDPDADNAADYVL